MCNISIYLNQHIVFVVSGLEVLIITMYLL